MQPLKTFILFAFILFISSMSFSQSTSIMDSEEEFEMLLNKGARTKEQGNYPRALEYYIKAEILSKNFKPDKMLLVKRRIADIYGLLSNFGEALGYYQQAEELAIALDSKNEIAGILNNIGLLYAWEKDYKQALNYFLKAYDVANSYNLPGYVRMQIAVNIAYVYNHYGQYKVSQKYLMEVRDLETNEAIRQMWVTNYAESMMQEGNVEAAEKMVKQLFEDPNMNCYVCISEMLSQIYAKQNRNELALVYAQKSLDHAASFSEKIDLYDHVAQIYLATKNYPLAFKYKDSVIAAKDSMSVRINRGLYESNKVKFKVQQYQNELQVNQHRQSAERKLYIISMIFGGILLFGMYRWLKNKQMQERKRSENRQIIADLELESLKNNIAEKNRKLSAKALYLSGRNELIEEVMKALSNIPEVTGNRQVVEYMKTLKGYLKSDDQWDEFIAYFEQANPDFLKTLASRHPQLSPADIRFICYVIMNLDIREISTIFNITINAATKRKRRIKEKMGIEREDSLYEYLTSIL